MARIRLTVEVREAPIAGVGAKAIRRPRRPGASAPGRPAIGTARRRLGRISLLVAVLLVAAGAVNYFRPIPAAAAVSNGLSQYTITGAQPALPWPNVGSAAVGATGIGLIGTSGDPAPVPAGSVAKVMAALVLLADRPLQLGNDGPTLTMTEQDVATYQADAADQQSVVPVMSGEMLTEYEALEALLIPSGNNIAETLARWDAGSVTAFVAKMNQRAAALHLTKTTFADPAGVSAQTVSTPTDMLYLGMAAMQQPVLAQIVGRVQAILPVAGLVYNVNGALGQSGIIGIKTGVNAGATFLFAAAATIDGHPLTIYGCVTGQPTLAIAFDAAQALIGAMQSALKMRPLYSRNDVVGVYNTAWGSQANLVSTEDLTLVEWPGMILRQQLNTQTLAVDGSVPSGTQAGTMHVVLGDQQADIPLVTSGSLVPPGLAWRLIRINW